MPKEKLCQSWWTKFETANGERSAVQLELRFSNIIKDYNKCGEKPETLRAAHSTHGRGMPPFPLFLFPPYCMATPTFPAHSHTHAHCGVNFIDAPRKVGNAKWQKAAEKAEKLWVRKHRIPIRDWTGHIPFNWNIYPLTLVCICTKLDF